MVVNVQLAAYTHTVTKQMQVLFDTLDSIFPDVNFTAIINGIFVEITLPEGKYPLGLKINSRLRARVKYIKEEYCIYLDPQYVEFYEKFKELVPDVTITEVFDNRYEFIRLLTKLQNVAETYYIKCKTSKYFNRFERLQTAVQALLSADLKLKTSAMNPKLIAGLLIAEIFNDN